MWSLKIISVMILATVLVEARHQSGSFKVRIYPYGNPRGQCCQWRTDTSPATCVVKCRYFFRVCANTTHSYRPGEMSCLVTKPTRANRTSDVSFPFYSPWTGSVNLLIQAWYGFPNFTLGRASQNSPFSKARLMTHMEEQHFLTAGKRWTRNSYHTTASRLDYAIKVSCESDYTRPFCMRRADKPEVDEEEEEEGFSFPSFGLEELGSLMEGLGLEGVDLQDLEERIIDIMGQRTFGVDLLQVGSEIETMVESFGNVVGSLFAFSSFLRGMKLVADFVTGFF